MRFSRLHPVRYLPLFSSVLLVCISPFCFARSTPIEMPPNATYAVPSRDRYPFSSDKGATAQSMVAYEVQALQKLMREYKELADNGGWAAWKVGKKLHQGDSDARIPALHQLLTVTGDYQSASGSAQNPLLYDATLATAVKHFQERHGLNADGELGKSTQTALAVPVEKRLAQIMATLERLHDASYAGEGKFILVNLPAYMLYGMEQGQPTLTMRVIIGNRQNHTPLFDKKVTDVVFNPPWSVPQRIARNELIPKLRANPSYFINAGFVVTQDGVPVDPMTANADSGDFSFRQRPGQKNALGKIKFNIPDSDNIYLHSTASPQLFAKEDRALSHGCVRLEKPEQLAHFVLRGEQGWDEAKIDHTYASNVQRNVAVSEIPVHLVYWTAFVDEQGSAHFYDDVYNKNNAVIARLKEREPITVASK